MGFQKAIAKVRGRNAQSTPTAVIVDQMNEPRPLPLGRAEFEAWSDRIIAGAMIPGALPGHQKMALADFLLHLGPTESHKPDAHFIHTLRKVVINQVAFAMRGEYKAIDDERKRAEEEATKLKVVPIDPTEEVKDPA